MHVRVCGVYVCAFLSLRACACACAYACACVYACVRACAWWYVCNTCIYGWMDVSVYESINTYMCLNTYVCVCTNVYIDMSIIYIFVRVETHGTRFPDIT